MTRTTEPIALDPNSALCGPRTISIRSTFSVVRCAKSYSPPNAFTGTSSTKTSVKLDSPPRGNTPVTAPWPPVAATVRPGTVRSASASEWTCRAWRSAAVITVTVDEACESGISTCAAETTTDSVSALSASVIVPSSRGDSGLTVSTWLRNPATATRISTRASAGRSIENAPVSSARTERSGTPSPETITVAPGTARPLGSTTRPVSWTSGSDRRKEKLQMKTRETDRQGRHAGSFTACYAPWSKTSAFARILRATADKPGSQVSWLAGRCGIPGLPMHCCTVVRLRCLRSFGAIAPIGANLGDALPAYSGGTAWASHPLRMTTGQSRSWTGSSSVIQREYHLK